MNRKLEKRLLHFYTNGGNIYEDFASSRDRKAAKLRLAVRICFYAHCAAAVIYIVSAAVMKAGAGIAAVAACGLVLAGISFMAAGGEKLLKAVLAGGDILFAAAMFVTAGLVGNKAPFLTVGAAAVVMAVIAMAAFFAADAKSHLEGYPPMLIKREHYTMLPDLGGSGAADTGRKEPETMGSASYVIYDIPDMPDEEELKLILPSPRTEMQELSDKLREILCKPVKKADGHASQTEDRS